MFKKFSKAEDVAASTKVKSSVQRGIRNKLVEQMPLLGQAGAEAEGETEPASLLETIWPKKEDLTLVKWSVKPAARPTVAHIEYDLAANMFPY